MPLQFPLIPCASVRLPVFFVSMLYIYMCVCVCVSTSLSLSVQGLGGGVLPSSYASARSCVGKIQEEESGDRIQEQAGVRQIEKVP